ncbi:MAG: aspartyl protease family protein [Akkermansiaceae bacterium]
MGPAFLRSITALLLTFVLTQCSSVPGGGLSGGREAQLKKMGYVSVPLEKVSGDSRFSGVFKVNDVPLKFLIDSGANSTDVEDRLATQVGLKRSDSVSVVTRGALGREIRSGLGTGSLQVGPIKALNFSFTIAPSGKRKTSTSRYAGQVGLDALNSTGSLVDIPRGCLWVPGPNAHRTRSGLIRPLGPKPALGVKMLGMGTAKRLPHLILHGTINGEHVSWVVDTGAEISVMDQQSFQRLGLPSVMTNSRMIDASGDRVALRRSRVKNLRFGDVNVRTFDIAIAPLSEVKRYFKDPAGRPIDGILGMDFLTNGQILLDSGSKILYLGQP